MSEVGRVGWSPRYGFHTGDSAFGQQALGSPVNTGITREEVRASLEEAARKTAATAPKGLQAEVNDLADYVENYSDFENNYELLVEHVEETLRRIRT